MTLNLSIDQLLKMQADSVKLSLILEGFQDSFKYETEPRYSYQVYEVIGTLESLNAEVAELLKAIIQEKQK